MTINNPGKTKKICFTVAAILLVLAIAFNVAMPILLAKFGTIINNFLVGDTVDTSGAGDVFEQADAVVQSSAEESMVLLENKDGYLPLDNLEKVNLFGWASTEYGFLLTGGGSGGTSITEDKKEKIDLNEAFENEGIAYNRDLYDAYCAFSEFDADYRSGGSTGANAADSLLNPEESFYTEERMTSAKEYSNVAVAVISRWGAENGGSNELVSISTSDGKTTYSDGEFLELTDQETAMFDALEQYGFEVIVVLNVCNNVEAGFVDDYSCIKACIFAGIPGQSGAIAIPRIINGTVNPSGKTSNVWAYDYNDSTTNPVYVNAVQSNSNIVYQEDIYYGYRWYETAAAEGFFSGKTRGTSTGYDAVVQYPFGYGLSYTSFEWDVTFPTGALLQANQTYTVEVTVTNTGDVAGKDVVQLYGHVDYVAGGIEKAERTLLDFAKTKLLKPGESETVTLTYTAYDLASYDAYDKNTNGFAGYEIEGGSQNVTISVQTDSHSFDEEYSQKYSVSGNIIFETDPVTGNTVGNLFTGSTAYADCPTDGSTAYTGGSAIEYLSRKDGFSNYSKLVRKASPNNSTAVNKAVSYKYDGYDTDEIAAEVETYLYGQDAGIYLVVADVDGTTVKATLSQLNGTETDVTLSVNKEMMQVLLDDSNADNNKEIWKVFLDQMTEDEIKTLIGAGGFQTSAIESIGKPLSTDKDGPAGFNNNVSNPGKSSEYPLFPSESLLGCSWSKDVNYQVGEAQGKIGTATNINGWYGPGVNLHRSIYNSRNYECYSEDGVLSGKLASSVIQGAKDNNLYCYLKHMVLSEPGQNPTNYNTWITEQNLRECYLKPFEIAVKEGGANAIMSSFNRVGAVLSGYNHALLTDILRNEWGFKGSVITDWFQGSGYAEDFERGILAGNNLWLAGTTNVAARIDLTDPAIAYAARLSVKNIIYTYIDTMSSAGSIGVNAAAQSPLIPILWVGLDVLLAAGIVVCTLFIVASYRQKPDEIENGSENSEPREE